MFHRTPSSFHGLLRKARDRNVSLSRTSTHQVYVASDDAIWSRSFAWLFLDLQTWATLFHMSAWECREYDRSINETSLGRDGPVPMNALRHLWSRRSEEYACLRQFTANTDIESMFIATQFSTVTQAAKTSNSQPSNTESSSCSTQLQHVSAWTTKQCLTKIPVTSNWAAKSDLCIWSWTTLTHSSVTTMLGSLQQSAKTHIDFATFLEQLCCPSIQHAMLQKSRAIMGKGLTEAASERMRFFCELRSVFLTDVVALLRTPDFASVSLATADPLQLSAFEQNIPLSQQQSWWTAHLQPAIATQADMCATPNERVHTSLVRMAESVRLIKVVFEQGMSRSFLQDSIHKMLSQCMAIKMPLASLTSDLSKSNTGVGYRRPDNSAILPASVNSAVLVLSPVDLLSQRLQDTFTRKSHITTTDNGPIIHAHSSSLYAQSWF